VESIGKIELLQRELAAICAAALNYLSSQWQKERPLTHSKDTSARSEPERKQTRSRETVAEIMADGIRSTNTIRVTKEDIKTSTDQFELGEAVNWAEEFVCLFYLNVISCVFMRIRTQVMIVGG
jgi:hypothetical protein